MKKFKLNAVIASILSLGTICSGFAFAMDPENKSNVPECVNASKNNNNSTTEVSKESMQIYYYDPEFKELLDLVRCFHENSKDDINRIFRELKKGRLGKIKNDKYKIPTCEDFISCMFLNRDILDQKLDYWRFIMCKYKMGKEERLLSELFKLLKKSMKITRSMKLTKSDN